MVPDASMTETLEKASALQEQEKRVQLGDAGLAQLADELTRATEANKVDVSPDLIAQMPAPPVVANVPRLNSETRIEKMDYSQRPFSAIQLVSIKTVFTHLQIGLPIAALAHHLRPWLTLFQSLLFQSPIRPHTIMSCIGADPSGLMDYRDVAIGLARDLVSHDASVGYGSQLLGTAWLPDYLVISGSCEHHNYQKMISWLLGVLASVIFDSDRIVTIARNLLSDISEIQRDGSDMVEAVLARVTTPKPTEQVASAADRESGVELNQNDIFISLFRQQAFLKGVLSRLETPDGTSEVIAALGEIKQYLLSTHYHLVDDNAHELSGFIQITAPSQPDDESPGCQLLDIWDKIALSVDQPTGVAKDVNRGPFPVPRSPYQVDMNAEFAAPGDLMVVALPALSASYLSCVLPCDVFGPVDEPDHPLHRDYFAVTVFCELLSRAEGPLYEAVRGKGFAYGASVHLRPWCGQLAYSVGEAQDPAQALSAFWQVLETLDTEWNSVCDVHALEAARSTVAYTWFSHRSTSTGIISAALNDAFRVSINNEGARLC
jgi:Zn-dependent M16 (insulinase) family peptidase